MKIRVALLLVFCLFAGMAQGQTGYIITRKNDTIRGEYKSSAFGRPKLKPVGASDFRPVNLDTLKEYQFTDDSSIYLAEILPSSSMNFISKPQFVQRLEHGKINLYQQVATSGMRLTTWYVSKTNDSLVVIKTDDLAILGGGSKKARMTIFANMISDDADVFSIFKQAGKFDFATIELCIHKYNLDMSNAKKNTNGL